MNLAAQYYRAPFPEEKYWSDDFARIKDSGLDAVQLWVLWAWVEPKPGEFRFDDYDRLVELAEKNGLGVFLSTIAEIQPYWIHREAPGSEMIDNMGHKVVSSNRAECHFGLTPGGCSDHPGVWERMKNFLTQVVTRYHSAGNLVGWDAWNELRWNVYADGLVCFCEHTLKSFRNRLDRNFGGLDGLNKAWKRRYGCWEEVMPGKLPVRPYTEMMAFEDFITWRASEHGKARCRLIKQLDPGHPVTLHGGAPSAMYSGSKTNYALDRGNDWDLADGADGIGTSSFPKWAGIDDAAFAARIDFTRSAARGKRLWLSELQGGSSMHAFDVGRAPDALSQQRWIWNGIACGAEAIIFWCWRNEVFGKESSGFGLSGNDGLAEERLHAMRRTGALLREHKDLLDGYAPDAAEVGLLFSPRSYHLNWAQEGTAHRTRNSLLGFCRALARQSIPYEVVEEKHLDVLKRLKILFMPRINSLGDETAAELAEFVSNGGTLVCESECGAFDPAGLFRYPEDRFIAKLSGCVEAGRRRLSQETIEATIEDEKLSLPVTQWLTPMKLDHGTVLADSPGGALLAEIEVGKGRAILCASYVGEVYLEKWSEGFERFVRYAVMKSGWQPDVEVLAPATDKDSFTYVKYGMSSGKRLVFVFFPSESDEVKLRLCKGFFGSNKAVDIISDKDVQVEDSAGGPQCVLRAPDWRFSVLVGE